jgi:hypothetical protein
MWKGLKWLWVEKEEKDLVNLFWISFNILRPEPQQTFP